MPNVSVVSNVYRDRRRSTLRPQAEDAYTRILRMLKMREIQPGVVFTEAELVRQLGMSRTPVREALHRLEERGHVVATDGRGYTCLELGIDDLTQIYQVRAALESLAAGRAASLISFTGLGRLKDLFASMEEAREGGDDGALARLNSMFHQTIAVESRNPYLQDMLSINYEVFERYRFSALLEAGRRDEAAAEHAQMLAALEARDEVRAAQLAAVHVSRALEARGATLTATTEGTPPSVPAASTST